MEAIPSAIRLKHPLFFELKQNKGRLSQFPGCFIVNACRNGPGKKSEQYSALIAILFGKLSPRNPRIQQFLLFRATELHML